MVDNLERPWQKKVKHAFQSKYVGNHTYTTYRCISTLNRDSQSRQTYYPAKHIPISPLDRMPHFSSPKAPIDHNIEALVVVVALFFYTKRTHRGGYCQSSTLVSTRGKVRIEERVGEEKSGYVEAYRRHNADFLWSSWYIYIYLFFRVMPYIQPPH